MNRRDRAQQALIEVQAAGRDAERGVKALQRLAEVDPEAAEVIVNGAIVQGVTAAWAKNQN